MLIAWPMAKSPRAIFSLTTQIVIGMTLGICGGLVAGSSFAPLGALGKLFIQLIKAIAVPLVFATIFEAILSTEIRWKDGRRLIRIALINVTAATTIAIVLVNIFHPGSGLDFRSKSASLGIKSEAVFESKRLSAAEVVMSHIPTSIAQPFLDNDIIGVVLLALLFGSAARHLTHQSPFAGAIENGARFCARVFETSLAWLIRLTPIAVFGVTAKTVAEYGLEPFKHLALYVAICMTGFIIQALVVYQLWIGVVARIPLTRFWHEARDTLFYAFGTNSSLATLPLTLNTLDRLGISKACSRLGACVGTNLNNDGIVLYEAMAVFFVAQAYGIPMPISEQVSAVLLSLLAAIGVAGVPEAGIISLSLVIGAVGMPLEILPLLLTVDWLIARARSVTNVLADMTVSIALNNRPIEMAREN